MILASPLSAAAIITLSQARTGRLSSNSLASTFGANKVFLQQPVQVLEVDHPNIASTYAYIGEIAINPKELHVHKSLIGANNMYMTSNMSVLETQGGGGSYGDNRFEVRFYSDINVVTFTDKVKDGSFVFTTIEGSQYTQKMMPQLFSRLKMHGYYQPGYGGLDTSAPLGVRPTVAGVIDWVSAIVNGEVSLFHVMSEVKNREVAAASAASTRTESQLSLDKSEKRCPSVIIDHHSLLLLELRHFLQEFIKAVRSLG